MKIQRYEVVYANSEQAFVERINKMIEDGWQPLGGMAANFQHNGQFQQAVYHQAMVQYEADLTAQKGLAELEKIRSMLTYPLLHNSL
jgi:hypothetical protein